MGMFMLGFASAVLVAIVAFVVYLVRSGVNVG